MPRESNSTQNRIALLATGDEVVNGDILNTNAQIIAQKLFRHGMSIGIHMTASDHVNAIEECISYLLNQHRALIITGGLGPTSDDLTRYALSNASGRSLLFDEAAWMSICDRFKVLGYTGEPPTGNRQQALFPEGARIIPNANGTAAGCILEVNDKTIFMLPGPPFECLPLVDHVVLPTLQEKQFQTISYFEHWLLFGIGESLIANRLDEVVKPFNCTTGYRIAYPYIEFKLHSTDQSDFQQALPLVQKIIAPYLLNNGKHTCSTELLHILETRSEHLTIHDEATGGLLQSILYTPQTFHALSFANAAKSNLHIEGLKEYWAQTDSDTATLILQFADQTIEKSIQLRGRGPRVKQFAVEFICSEILKRIRS